MSSNSSKKVYLNNKKSFDSENSETILASAKRAGFILEYSCNNGQCGICSCNLLSGKVDSSADKFHTELEKKSGQVLTCQAVPLTDIEIDIEDLGEYAKYPSKTLPARVSNINFISKDLLKLTLRTPPNNQLAYLPGQYVDLIYGSIRRSYSIANKPRDDGTIDLIIKKVANGRMSDVLFSEVKQNDLFRIEGPLGTFGWRDSVKKNVVFMVTGTGIAPAISILEGVTIRDKDSFLIWGNRVKDEFFELNLSLNDLEVHKVLSRECAEDYQSGHVQGVLLSLGIDLKDTIVFACGSDAMIQASRSTLIDNGLHPKSFYSDSFLSSGK